MQLNRSTDYAIRTLICLAKAAAPMSSSKLSSEIGVSQRYLLQIGAKLRNAGFIKTAHGVSGGYELSKPPAEISLCDIIILMEGIDWVGQSKPNPMMEDSNKFYTLVSVYQTVEAATKQHLRCITLDKLLNRDK